MDKGWSFAASGFIWVSQFRFNFRQYGKVKVAKGTFPGSCAQHVGTGFLAGCWQALTAYPQAASWGTEHVQGIRADERNSTCKDTEPYRFAEGTDFGGESLGSADRSRTTLCAAELADLAGR